MIELAQTNKQTPCVYVVDDDPALLASFDALLSAKGLAFELFRSGEALLRRLDGRESGCVLLDYSMPGANGVDVLKTLRRNGHNLPVIMITAHGDITIAVEAMRAGAIDFIEKPWATNALLLAIETALRHDQEQHGERESQHQARALITSFTRRERDVFDRLVEGANNKHIARELDISPRTVEFYRANVLEKAGVDSIAGLVRLAIAARQIET